MPTPKKFTDEEIRLKKNARSKQRYAENKERLLAYHAARHLEKSADPEYRRLLAAKSRAYRAANPQAVREQNMKRRANNPDAERARCREWFAANPEKRAAVVTVPVAVVADVVTLGGAVNDKDRPYTADAISDFVENVENIAKPNK